MRRLIPLMALVAAAATAPACALRGQELPVHLSAMLGALLFVPPLVLAWGLLREKSIGRFDALPADRITGGWLEENLLDTRPEIIGAMWDESVGPAEVTAVLARMVREKKIETKVAGKELQMTLLVPRDQLEGYERSLIDGFFFEGDRTSSGEIQRHYDDNGFDPARMITHDLLALAEGKLPKGKMNKAPGAVPSLVFLAGAAALVYAVRQREDMLMPAVWTFGVVLFVMLFAAALPAAWRKRKGAGVLFALLSMVPAAIGVGAAAYVVWRSEMRGDPDISFEIQLGITLLTLWGFMSAVWVLLSHENRESFEMRRMLTAAREFFRSELRKPQPALDDAWYPYVLAFGLGREAEQWFQEFAAATSSPASSFAPPPSWTGGGESFGGAGAAAWTAAVATVASNIAPRLRNTRMND